MKSNPGGYIGSEDVIGRDGFIDLLWKVINQQSLVLSAERRMGKTCIVQKMAAEAPKGIIAIYHDFEGVESPLEFVRILFNDVERYLARKKQFANRARMFLKKFHGAEFKGFKMPWSVEPHWKELLVKTIEDLKDHQEDLLVFFWDEIPMMLDKMTNRSGADFAMELLDALRSLRQMNSKLRMVFTGSIGIHHVISTLKEKGYTNEPINDMHIEDLPTLATEDAVNLAHKLLEGEELPVEQPDATCKAIASEVDCIPYFIHHIVGKIARERTELNPDVVGEIVLQGLTNPMDAWDLNHYRDRINSYFVKEEQPFVLKILDIIARSEIPLPFFNLFNLLKSDLVTEDEEMIRKLIKMLMKDHYILQAQEGGYYFKFPLIKRWWRIDRGLES